MEKKTLFYIGSIVLVAAVALFIVWAVRFLGIQRAEDIAPAETPEERIRRELLAPPQYPLSEGMEQQIKEDLTSPPLHSLTEEEKERIREDLLAPAN
ncbi:MAG TPA: hypothetical protein DIS53_00065 [Candidatus Wildermuthbacteria bacterium]|nr:MAG: hypothetical protein UY53_C0011G0013 [Parcubacteria group bacterium GW2011_GWA2_50_10]OHA75309.1 MAG: hypothetical protein A3B28_03415 [Candidatus Wildermuthbacteria bacterium RIFCSPLOWO2_01_FULL_50_46]OHA78338.1 MAG: hypothetical protein A2564_03750 [Candidatus Wildermuthbacteria bacterium RIFOXYD1_FULL_50_12]HCM36322.1 hypothetical protein [Candidatus Wildermuthbacteria bacterium]